MIPNPALDTAISQARQLLFAFDGPIRSASEAKPLESTATAAPTPAFLHETLAACHESGRSVAVIIASPPVEVQGYLNTHDLLTQISVIAVSIEEAASTLDATPAECLLITSSPADIAAAKAIGTPSIGYARNQDDAAHLVDVGANAAVYSLADVALRLRAQVSG